MDRNSKRQYINTFDQFNASLLNTSVNFF